MDNITALGMQARQQAMLDRLHNTAAVASSGDRRVDVYCARCRFPRREQRTRSLFFAGSE